MSETQSTGAAPEAVASEAIAADSGINARSALSGVINEIQPQQASAEESESADEGQEDLSLSEKKEELKELKKKLKLKVDGKEIEREIDLMDEATITRELQKAAAFEARAQELSTLKKQATEFINQLKSNPASVLSKLGINVEEMSEHILAQKVEEMSKSPEQLEREKMQKELEEYKAQLEEQKKHAEEERFEKLKNQYAQEIESDIIGALNSGKTVLPKSPLVIKRVAETMALAMQNGYDNVRAADVIPVVEKQFRKELSELFEVLPEETLEEVVGRKNIDRLRKKRVQAAKPNTQTAKQVAKPTGNAELNSKKAEKAVEKRKFEEVFDLRKL